MPEIKSNVKQVRSEEKLDLQGVHHDFEVLFEPHKETVNRGTENLQLSQDTTVAGENNSNKFSGFSNVLANTQRNFNISLDSIRRKRMEVKQNHLH